MNIDTSGDVCSRDDIDAVGGLLLGRLDGRRFDKTYKARAIAVDGVANPVSNWHSWSSIVVINVPASIPQHVLIHVHDND